MENRKINCVVICGPTASGKTHLAVYLSLRFKGEIISADSRQVYRGMNLGTGKDLNEYSTPNGIVKVHLIDIRNPDEIFTVYHFKQDFYQKLDEINERNQLPFLTGGTGLYIESILRNYDIPHVPENVEFRKKFMTKDKDELIEELKRSSPELYQKTDLKSKKRVVRSLEIATFGSAITHDQTTNTHSPIRPVVLCTRWERAVLYERIDRRLSERIDNGMIDEVRTLIRSGVSIERLVQFGMEYKHITQYLNNQITFDKMTEALKRDIHQLAKRQETWFRGMERRGIKINWVDNADCTIAVKILEELLS
jgi:tRNA dimethylallyltransferase